MGYQELKRRQSVMWGTGPYQRVTETLADSLGERREELHRDWVDFFESNYRVNGEIAHTREYLLVTGVRR